MPEPAHVYFHALPIGEKFGHQGDTYVKVDASGARQLTGPAADRCEWTFEGNYGALISDARAQQLRLPPSSYVVRDNPVTTGPMTWGRAWLYGWALLAAGGTVGAVVGAATAPRCKTDAEIAKSNELLANLFCGPGFGAAFGGGLGVLTGSAVGGVTAYVSKKYRRPGVIAAGVGVALITTGLVIRAARGTKRNA